MKISAIICTRNRPNDIARAVSTVLANDHPSFELIVIDQSDSDATQQALAPFIGRVQNLRYLHTKQVGLSPARNRGIAESYGEILAFTDDDCAVPPDWLHQIERVFEREVDVDLLYGQVKVAPELAGVSGHVPALESAVPRRMSRPAAFEVFGMGANFAARRRLFEEIGGFDNVLGAGCAMPAAEDFDLQLRVYRAGFVRFWAPTVVLDHYGHRTAEQWPRTLEAYGAGNLGFYLKHMRCYDPVALRLLLVDIARSLAKVLKRRPGSVAYIHGFAQGLRTSLTFSVDRRTRLYVKRTA